MNQKIEAAIEILKGLDPDTLTVGRHEVNEDFYYLVQEYESRPIEKCRLEAHEKYADIQWMVKGTEAIQVCSHEGLTVTDPYNPEKDIEFYAQKEDIQRIVLTDGAYVVLYPQDVHEPCIAVGAPAPVKKIVGKVRL